MCRTTAKELIVAKELPNNYPEQRTSNLKPSLQLRYVQSGLIITSKCYIKSVRAESVCTPSLLRMVSDSSSISPGPGWPDWKLVQSWCENNVAIWTVTIQGNGIGGTCCCCAYIVVRNDIRDPLATKRSLFVSFRFILEPSSDNLRLITKLQIKVFILNYNWNWKWKNESENYESKKQALTKLNWFWRIFDFV